MYQNLPELSGQPRNTCLKIDDDLLQIVLNQRLGREFSLKARAYSDEYIIDVEKKIIFNPGPDGESYTKDDIKLPKCKCMKIKRAWQDSNLQPSVP